MESDYDVDLETLLNEIVDAVTGPCYPNTQLESSITDKQYKALTSTEEVILIDGGNRSGKTRTAVLDCVAYALNMHPVMKWEEPIHCWFCGTTYALIKDGAYKHFLTFLLHEGEDEWNTPTINIKTIRRLSNGKPQSIELNNGSEITFKSYEQGEKEFQSANVHAIYVDEECPDKIWREVQARQLSIKNPRIVCSMTPVKGYAWVDDLRDQAVQGVGGAGHVNFETMDNPAKNEKAIQNLIERYRDDPDELELRLRGIPKARVGPVYPAHVWTAEHSCDPFYLDPGKWRFYKCVDPSFTRTASLWLGVNQMHDYVFFREYVGERKTIGQNCEAINAYELTEAKCEVTYMDPNMGEQTQQNSGERVVDLYSKQGVDCTLPQRVGIYASIEKVYYMLGLRGGVNGEYPKVRFFSTLKELHREKRGYRWPDDKGEGRRTGDKPDEKGRNDDLLDCMRYLLSIEPKWTERPQILPPVGSMGRKFYDARMNKKADNWL